MSINLMDAGLNVLQSAFFISNIDFANKIETASLLMKSVSALGEVVPTILPIPDDAPKEIPRIIINTKDNKFSLTVSLERIDFFIKDYSNGDIEEKYLNISNDIAAIILNNLKINIYRLAQICQFKQSFDSDALSTFRNKVSEDFINNAKEIQLHRLKLIKIDDYDVNQWLRLVSDHSNHENPILIINTDTNTVVRDSKSLYDIDKTKSFFRLSIDSTKELLAKL